MYLLLLTPSTDFAHVMSHLAKIAFGIAMMILLLFAVSRLAVRATGSGKTKRRFPGSANRHQRR